MAPGTTSGAAHPVRGDGVTMDPVMKEKLENFAASLMRSYAAKRGRNVEVAESAIRQSKSFSADEALSQHLIDRKSTRPELQSPDHLVCRLLLEKKKT